MGEFITIDKEMPDDPVDLERLGRWLRERVAGHSLNFKMTVYATPRVWLAVAAILDPQTPS